ncbi:hypothetical protein ACIXQX_17585 [Bacteroides fragilis]|jgi:hypothetical protein|uniref:hypothetical protein n=1 Tax=Bacteroides fragilis TaxID=817 RepID=UPI000451A67D|nr:hypothetical protein [Bacteroides fragilis]EXZ16698.1 hypothetical protein M067_4960 [Bacteroides fragilis str. J-143-4]
MEKQMFKNLDKIKNSVYESINSDNGVIITIGQSYSTTSDEEMKISVCIENEDAEIVTILSKDDAERLCNILRGLLYKAD